MKYFYLKQNISNWLSWYSSLDCGEFPLLQHDWKLSCCRDRGRRQEAGWQQLSLCVYTFQTCNNHIPLARVNHHTAAINIMNDGILKWDWSRLTRERVKLSTSSSSTLFSDVVLSAKSEWFCVLWHYSLPCHGNTVKTVKRDGELEEGCEVMSLHCDLGHYCYFLSFPLVALCQVPACTTRSKKALCPTCYVVLLLYSVRPCSQVISTRRPPLPSWCRVLTVDWCW